MSVRRLGGGSGNGSQGPLHLPSDDLPRVDGQQPPQGRPGPEKLQGEPVAGPVSSYTKKGQWEHGGRRTLPKSTEPR